MKTNRKAFIEALDHVKHTLVKISSKPIFHCVRMEARGGKLTMQATDLEIELSISIPAEGDLDPCLVDAEKLMTRIKAGKHETCVLEVQRTGETVKDTGGDWESYNLVVNGGKVSHKLPGECLHDFCLNDTPVESLGELTISGQEFVEFVPVALAGIANENTRYAINGVLLEVGEHHRRGRFHRLVGTDGRRMVRIDLKTVQTEATPLQTILAEKTCDLLRRLLGKKCRETMRVVVNKFAYPDDGKREDGTTQDRPQNCVVFYGENWTLKALPVEGHFPQYDEVWPEDDLNEWQVSRADLLEVIQEVALATKEDYKAVFAHFDPTTVKLTAGRAWNGESEGEVSASFVKGKENKIITAFNPSFLKDALRYTDSDTVTIWLVQNRVGHTDSKVYGAPIQIIGNQVGWLVMPVNLDMEPSIESIGYNNYAEYAARTGKVIPDAIPA